MMFLHIDKHKANNLVAIDSNGLQITYGELCGFCHEFGKLLPSRSLLFALSENTVGGFAGYMGCMENKVVPLLLASSIDRGLLSDLFCLYKPQYIWAPERLREELGYLSLFSWGGYCLMRTEFEFYEMSEQLSMLMTTSGSTGSPKLVRYKYGNLEANAKNVATFFGWTKLERPICDLPMQYTMGLNVINSHVWVGATLLLTNQNLMSGEFWKFIKEFKATNFTGVPFSYDLLSRLRFMRMDLPHLTTIAEGGGKLTNEMFRSLAEYAEKTGKRFFATFGTTETSARLAYLPAELALVKTGSIGKAIPEGELLLKNESGEVIKEVGVHGELVYRGPNVTMGYALSLSDLQKGDEFNGEYSTGDIACKDEDGYYYIAGRKSRFLKLLGLRVSLDQSEQLIKSEFDVECACLGDDNGMRIYVTTEGLEEKIRMFISNKTGIHFSLFEVNVISDIPKNESGKIIYKQLANSLFTNMGQKVN